MCSSSRLLLIYKDPVHVVLLLLLLPRGHTATCSVLSCLESVFVNIMVSVLRERGHHPRGQDIQTLECFSNTLSLSILSMCMAVTNWIGKEERERETEELGE